MQKVGRSEHTELKQKNLEYILSVQLKIFKHIIANHKWVNDKIFYADIYAGDGGINDCAGSPLIFEKVCNENSIKCDPIFIEENPVTAKRLSAKIKSSVINDRNENVLPQLYPEKNQLGIIYVDPNGDPKFDMLEDFYNKQNTKMIDLLIYFSGTTIKRAFKSPITKRDISLIDNITRLPKKKWLVRNATGKFQWSFLLGSNWIDVPRYKSIGFYEIDSIFGRSVLNIINYTKEELKNIKIKLPDKQLTLF
ncbi:hypothetical protein [Desulfobacula sp.]|uniref:hypothetical protein n=1 Tax=Desulfobacula sp. TaxID=2593537 RepID=UPI001EC19414|nr:hypothetical protein [Desulfobacula sp.]